MAQAWDRRTDRQTDGWDVTYKLPPKEWLLKMGNTKTLSTTELLIYVKNTSIKTLYNSLYNTGWRQCHTDTSLPLRTLSYSSIASQCGSSYQCLRADHFNGQAEFDTGTILWWGISLTKVFSSKVTALRTRKIQRTQISFTADDALDLKAVVVYIWTWPILKLISTVYHTDN